MMLEFIVDLNNMNAAMEKVIHNKGAAGIDKVTVNELKAYFTEHVFEIRQAILNGTYRPQPVRRVAIPKDLKRTKMRMLGIPTVMDRVIQQATLQILQPMFEPQFAETSYGFRPGRSCHDAVRKCLEYANEGYVYVADMDLEKFFDTVNQSKLIQVLSKTIKDGRIVSLIHRFLNAGAVWMGKFEETEYGVPQGGPLSPLLANVMLNELDHELEHRGHKYVRYADDLVILCKSKASAQQTLDHITPYIEKKLFLKVNREKTIVAHITDIKFLGFGFYYANDKGIRPRLHNKTREKLMYKLRGLTERDGRYGDVERKKKLREFVTGWIAYYALADIKSLCSQVDAWLRRRIRCVIWHRWKRVRTRYRNLRACGFPHWAAIATANSRKGAWAMAKSAMINRAMSNDRLAAVGYTFLTPCYLKRAEALGTLHH